MRERDRQTDRETETETKRHRETETETKRQREVVGKLHKVEGGWALLRMKQMSCTVLSV